LSRQTEDAQKHSPSHIMNHSPPHKSEFRTRGDAKGEQNDFNITS